MLIWRPVRSLGGAIAFLLALLWWGAAAYLATWLLLPLSGLTFWLALGVLVFTLLGGLFLYWGVALITMRYTFDRNGLTLHWGGSYQVIPMNQITFLRRWKPGERVREFGLLWPGCHRGRGRSAELGVVQFYATAGPPSQVVVGTAEGAYVLSPRHPDDFIQEIQIRQNLGVNRQLAHERRYWWLLGWNIWQDRTFWVISGLALLVNLSLLALLCYRYPTLPPLLPTHFVEILEEGQERITPDVIGPASDLFKLPAFGLLLLGGNFFLGVLLHRRHRPLVLILTAVALLVQVMFWLGTFYILSP